MFPIFLFFATTTAITTIQLNFQAHLSGPDIFAFRDESVFEYSGEPFLIQNTSVPIERISALLEDDRLLGSKTHIHLTSTCYPVVLSRSQHVTNLSIQLQCHCNCPAKRYVLDYEVTRPQTGASAGIVSLLTTDSCNATVTFIRRTIFSSSGTRLPFIQGQSLALI